jgi:hypothetical protein
LHCVLLVDVVEDKQPRGVVRLCKLSYNVPYYCINIGAAIYSIIPACLRNLA